MLANDLDRSIERGAQIAARGINLEAVRFGMPPFAEAAEKIGDRRAAGRREKPSCVLQHIGGAAQTSPRGINRFAANPNRQGSAEGFRVGAEEGGK